jgi:hypothetical protein
MDQKKVAQLASAVGILGFWIGTSLLITTGIIVIIGKK